VGEDVGQWPGRRRERVGTDDADGADGDPDVEQGGEAQGQQQRARHRPGRLPRLFRQRDHLVEPDEGEKDQGCRADDPGWSGPGEEVDFTDVGETDGDHGEKAADLDQAEDERQPAGAGDAAEGDEGDPQEQSPRSQPRIDGKESVEVASKAERDRGRPDPRGDDHEPADQEGDWGREDLASIFKLTPGPREHRAELGIAESG
jgi:hypothetical protein